MRAGEKLQVKMLMMVLALAMVMVYNAVGLRSSHPFHGLVDRVNENGGPYVGLVMAYPTEEIALESSGVFVPSSQVPYLDLSGRRFNIGKIKDVDVIHVMSGEQTLNAGMTVQILVDAFDIKGIVHYGTAGSANNSLSFGDVSVPTHFAFTGSWKWKEFGSTTKTSLAELSFGTYNLPSKGENLLAEVEFTPQQLYSNRQPMQEVFWLPVEPHWFSVATQLEDLKLEQCVNETYCLPETPKIVYGLRGSTADTFVDNAAYRRFLFKEFNVSTVDEESSAVVMASLTNGVPCVVFRGVSDLAGGGGGGGTEESTLISASFSSLAAVNALNVAVEFIGLIGNPRPALDH
ncbi:hypothetical protein RJ640_028393 [Escallonia rubra]|uniref:Nucleoside phosphorylase domain-containing protein n=1 Tax=Escallonia rubra TaxID=112253 RepID=A0AA88RAK7_9ASTE|nr:hypothetical protein RJ640_028393 [Escallonia rubra]